MAWNLLQSVKQGLSRTRETLSGAFSSIMAIGRKVDEAFLEELEEALIVADVGPRLAMEMTEDVRRRYKNREIQEADEIVRFLKGDLVDKLVEKDLTLGKAENGPTVIIFVGVNGTGKTTTTAKLAWRYAQEGQKVLLAAADTFRAAAGEQLDIWAQRLGVEIVRHRDGADPGAVVFDACEAAVARDVDYVIVDTAGRLHTKENLMRELDKIRRIAEKKIGTPPQEMLLVLDATTGQNALSQAQLFSQGVGLTGMVLTKLDGTAKGGIAVAINRAVDLPIKLIGVGEGQEDLADFDPKAFVDAMFSGIEQGPESLA
ncbi:MAG: signal recognition particle-docking protein FtsY [Planctomycetota bacterium]|jgi:fused signal recognition particle receptor